MTAPTDPVYWEDWARSLGWNEEKLRDAGRVGSLEADRGLALLGMVMTLLSVAIVLVPRASF